MLHMETHSDFERQLERRSQRSRGWAKVVEARGAAPDQMASSPDRQPVFQSVMTMSKKPYFSNV
jgi:hypothetical protein